MKSAIIIIASLQFFINAIGIVAVKTDWIAEPGTSSAPSAGAGPSGVDFSLCSNAVLSLAVLVMLAMVTIRARKRSLA